MMDDHAVQTATRLAETIEAKDPFTRGHSRAVSVTAVALGQECGLKGDNLRLVEVAGLLHDIGYIDLDPSILTKPSRLTLSEFERIRAHPEVGAGIVRSIPSLCAAAEFIGHHHERCDGTGYPMGVKAQDIPLEGRILGVAETYDALTAHRAHRAAFPPIKVIRGLKTAARSQLDPDLVDALIGLLSRLAHGKRLETLRELPSLDEVVWVEQRKLREIYSAISTSLGRILDHLMGHLTRRLLERDFNELLQRGGIHITIREGEVEDRLPSRAQPADLAAEYRAALAQQIGQLEHWVGSRMTRYYLGGILDYLGPDAMQICRVYRLCEVPMFERNPKRVPDSPVVISH